MSDRIIQTPGEAAQPEAAAPAAAPVERKKPGPKPKAAAAPAPAGDDLDEFESDKLPPKPEAADFTPEQMRRITAMVAAAVQASRSAQDPQTAAKLAAKANTVERLPSQAEAAAMCEDMVSQNLRPRAILTPEGWYVHPEAVRTVDHGVAKLQVG